nr:FAD-linked oxidase C-terminal domain-containing protein [Inmirania thermothiophila]
MGAAAVRAAPADCWPYGYDNSRRHAAPGAVVFPASEEEVAGVVRLCAEHRIPLVARGRGTGTTGAAVPTPGGVVLSTERMARILAVEPDDRLLVAQPGATNAEVQEAAAAHGFFWPPDPTSAAFCTVGGNLAYNSAGPRAVKYGTCRENTLGLRAVDGTGRAFRTGVRTTKGVVGYDLTRLLVGSEGTLAVITEATLRLVPLPEATATLRAVYTDVGAAARAVASVMAQPVTPCALEFMDGNAIALVRERPEADLPAGAGAMLMIEVDGPAHGIDHAAEAVARAASVEGLVDLRRARDATEVAALWAARKALSPALRQIAPKKINEDVAVPVSRLPALIEGLGALARRHRIRIVNFGHAGNGNIHVNLLADPDDADEMARARACLAEVFDLVLRLDGTLSGEHGVGLEKQPFVGRELDAHVIALSHAIKAQFDPFGILNPGKVFPPPDQEASARSRR